MMMRPVNTRNILERLLHRSVPSKAHSGSWKNVNLLPEPSRRARHREYPHDFIALAIILYFATSQNFSAIGNFSKPLLTERLESHKTFMAITAQSSALIESNLKNITPGSPAWCVIDLDLLTTLIVNIIPSIQRTTRAKYLLFGPAMNLAVRTGYFSPYYIYILFSCSISRDILLCGPSSCKAARMESHAWCPFSAIR